MDKRKRDRVILGIIHGTYCPACGLRFEQSDIDQGRHVSNADCQRMICAADEQACFKDAAKWALDNP